MPARPYNPLDHVNLARSVELTLLQQEAQSLPLAETFAGAGLYALYYQGNFEPYAPISAPNGSGPPIYVGRARPTGARTGVQALDAPAGRVLFHRLREHWKSIEVAKNLDIVDFRCRYLVCEELFISMGEALLITQFRPLWNRHVAGFGLHDPGRGRHGSERSEWDELHPGRPWYPKMKRAQTPQAIRENIAQVFESGEAATVNQLPVTAPPTAPAELPEAPASAE